MAKLTKLIKKRRAARQKRLARARYLHARGCVVCDGWASAISIAEYLGQDFTNGEVKHAGGGRWWRYDGRDEFGDPMWSDVEPYATP